MIRHKRNGLIASIMLALLALISCATIKPVCRHIVLSQYAAAVDAGYEARIVTFKNPAEMRKKTGYKYHQAVEVCSNGEWGHWVSQPPTSWAITRKQPAGIILRCEP